MIHNDFPGLTRRSLLRTAGTLALGFAAAGCSVHSAAPTPKKLHRRLAPVNVAPDRVIRTVAGLRPFRRNGFLVRADRFDDKTIVHNYGHGGCGVTLSWGTADMAVEDAMKSGQSRFAVLGCGVAGLSTAILLQRRGAAEVTIYAKDLPPYTTSNIAGASWRPSFLIHSNRRTPEFDAQFERAARFAHRYFQNFLDPRYGVRFVEEYLLLEKPDGGWGWSHDLIADLFPMNRLLGPGEHPFDSPYAKLAVTMMIEPSIYLSALERDFRLAGGRIVRRSFASLQEIQTLPEPVIVNCTGLGSRDLFGDEEMMPIKGQLSFLLPQPEIDYLVAHDGLYMFPRTDGILLGGTFESNVWDLAPDPEKAREMIAGHQKLFAGMRKGLA